MKLKPQTLLQSRIHIKIQEYTNIETSHINYTLKNCKCIRYEHMDILSIAK